MLRSCVRVCFLVCAAISTSMCLADASPEEGVDVAGGPYAGKVVGSKVRLRLAPDLGAPVVDLLDEGAYLLVQGEDQEFYAVTPPEGTKAYIYRPYVLDGTVEGSHVNVRLHPDVDAPILGQLNTGDSVCGEVCPDNTRWMEIAMPDAAHFYVAKDYIQNAGSAELVTNRAARREAAEELLQQAYLAGQQALSGPVTEINRDELRAGFAQVSQEYPDFPEYAVRADTFLEMMEQLIEQRELAVAQGLKEDAETTLSLDELDQLAFGSQTSSSIAEIPLHPVSEREFGDPMALARPAVEREFVSDKMLVWEPLEESLYEVWAMDRMNASLDAFYQEQMLDGVVLTGIVETYDRPVRNRPGDYLLVQNGRPAAFLYSTQVNLEEVIGQEVTVRGVPRPNHNFAFPAYFVLAAED